METYAKALNIGIPLFVVLILIEMLYSKIVKKDVFNAMDNISSLSSGITNVVKDVLGLSIVIVSYSWLESKIGMIDIKPGITAFILAFIGKDFSGYWIHRLEHRVNFFWNRHIIHHSSEEFNLSCALRQSISTIFSFTTFFLLPMAIIGVPGEVFALVAPIHLFAQFWYHTRLIDKMGPLEYVLVTPSHHRVHHAINPEYMDKNFSQIFIIWDKLFGTFQEELDSVPAVYGVKRPVHTYNPIIINFQHAWLIVKDFWRTSSWSDKLRIWFMPTGWRPSDVEEKYPVETIQNVYQLHKYSPGASVWLKAWSHVQLTTTLLLMLYLFNRIAELPWNYVLFYGFFIMLSVHAYTTLMDRKGSAVLWEGLKSVLGISIISYTGDWFLISEVFPAGKAIVFSYFVMSIIVVACFVKLEIEKDNSMSHTGAVSS